jgi:PAS domain S-box-containing protein
MLVGAFMSNIPDHIYFKDRDSRFVWVNAALARMLGSTVDEVLGKTDFDFFDEVKARAFRDAELEIMRTGEPRVDQVIKHTWSDGRETWSLNVAMPLKNAVGEIVGIFGTNKDITESRLLQQQVEQAHSELRELSRLSGMAEVAAGVLHDFGNALNSVGVSSGILGEGLKKLKVDRLAKVCAVLRESGLADLVRAHPQGGALVDYLEELQKTLADDQRSLIEEVDSLRTKLEDVHRLVRTHEAHARVPTPHEDFGLKDVIEDSLRMNRDVLLQQQIHVEQTYGLAPRLTAPRGKVLQTLNVLIRNAAAALASMPVRGRVLKLAVEGTSAHSVRILVRDNGVGFAPAQVERLFGQDLSLREGQYGFGLHAAASVAHELGGSLIAASEGPGRGATFILELPLAPSSPKLPTSSAA